jgi:hypothetical protein
MAQPWWKFWQQGKNTNMSASGKKTSLPEDFRNLLDRGNEEEILAVFRDTDVNARGGYGKQTALAFDRLPDKVATWLVENGADFAAKDTWGYTPLHNRAGSRRSSIAWLLALGADPHAKDNSGGTPLHSACDSHNAESARLLLEHGARIDEPNAKGLTPLELALRSCANIDIEATVDLSELLLKSGAKRTPRMKEFVTKIGQNFEFHRSGFDPDSVDSTSSALHKLYGIFEVAPVPIRQMHDGKSPIRPKSNTWQKQHQELWELLVPSGGQAETVQGEVIRITGRITDEMERNGGANWDNDYEKMADTFLRLTGGGAGLSPGELNEVRSIVKTLKEGYAETSRMAELAVKWVIQNPDPVHLAKQAYER